MIPKLSEMTTAERHDYRHALAALIRSGIPDGARWSIVVVEDARDVTLPEWVGAYSSIDLDSEAAKRFAIYLEGSTCRTISSTG